jgi:hypothetical protein
VDVAQVQTLVVARTEMRNRAQELAARLEEERAQAEKVARLLHRTKARNAAKVHALASQNLAGQPVTLEQYQELERELGPELELARELGRVEAQVQSWEHAWERAQSTVQDLAQALAMAEAVERARVHAQKQAQAQEAARALAQKLARSQAQSPRSRAIEFARFLWRLMQAPWGLWDGIAQNLYLGMRIVTLAAWMLPTADRARWKQESYSELEQLQQEQAPLLGNAARIAVRIPWLAAVLWTNAWGRSPMGRWLARREPLWIGLGTMAATFCAGAAGIGRSLTDGQMKLLVAASLLFGALATWQACKARQPRQRGHKER